MSSSSSHAYNIRKKVLTNSSFDRRIRIINSTIGEDRKFGGKVITQAADTMSAPQKALVCYADGSFVSNGWGMNDALGAGIAWEEGSEEEPEEGEIVESAWRTEPFALGINTGDIADAELFALAAALGFAVKQVEQGKDVQQVRVYTDCMRILLGIEKGSIDNLGPAIGGTWALQQLYDCADWLEGNGVGVELVWVKGHAGEYGNELADKAAKRGLRSQIEKLGKPEEKRKMKKKEDAPVAITQAGEDAVEEWYWRVNKPLLLSGEEETEDDGAMSDASMDISSDED